MTKLLAAFLDHLGEYALTRNSKLLLPTSSMREGDHPQAPKRNLIPYVTISKAVKNLLKLLRALNQKLHLV